MIKFAERLQELRKGTPYDSKGDGEVFCKYSCVPINLMEGDDRRPDYEAVALADYFGVSTDYLLGALRGAVAVQWDESRDHVDGLATHPRFLFKASKRKRAASVSGTAANGGAMRGQKKNAGSHRTAPSQSSDSRAFGLAETSLEVPDALSSSFRWHFRTALIHRRGSDSEKRKKSIRQAPTNLPTAPDSRGSLVQLPSPGASQQQIPDFSRHIFGSPRP
ncbi:MAG: hypothetical protein V8R75_08340 [Oscillospiraceae bacterium]